MSVFSGVAGSSTKTGTESSNQQLDPMGRAAVYTAAGKLDKAYNKTPFRQLNANSYVAPVNAGQRAAWNAAYGLQTPEQFQQAGNFYTDVANRGFGSAEAQQYMNPYTEAVTRTTMDELQRQHDAELAQLGLKNTFGAGLGSSGYALSQALSNRDYRTNAASTYAGLQQAGFENAYKRFADDLSRRLESAKGLESLGVNINNADIERIKQQMLAGADERSVQQQLLDLKLEEARKAREAPQLYATNFASGIAGLPWDRRTTGTATSFGKEVAPQGSVAGQVLGGLGGIYSMYRLLKDW